MTTLALLLCSCYSESSFPLFLCIVNMVTFPSDLWSRCCACFTYSFGSCKPSARAQTVAASWILLGSWICSYSNRAGECRCTEINMLERNMWLPPNPCRHGILHVGSLSFSKKKNREDHISPTRLIRNTRCVRGVSRPILTPRTHAFAGTEHGSGALWMDGIAQTHERRRYFSDKTLSHRISSPCHWVLRVSSSRVMSTTF